MTYPCWCNPCCIPSTRHWQTDVKSLSINTNLRLEPTPSGAFFTVSSNNAEPARRLLQGVMSESISPEWDVERLSEWSGLEQKEALDLLHRLQELGWMSGLEQAQTAPDAPLEEILPALLEQVSAEGKALLADNQGFYLATSGIPHEAAESLSAVSADLGSLYERHQRLLANNLGQREQAWSLTDAAGNSQLGFWPLHIGSQRFVLVIEGRPAFNQPAFRDLVWILTLRYSTERFWENATNHG
jgi:hypothetical protein